LIIRKQSLPQMPNHPSSVHRARPSLPSLDYHEVKKGSSTKKKKAQSLFSEMPPFVVESVGRQFVPEKEKIYRGII